MLLKNATAAGAAVAFHEGCRGGLLDGCPAFLQVVHLMCMLLVWATINNSFLRMPCMTHLGCIQGRPRLFRFRLDGVHQYQPPAGLLLVPAAAVKLLPVVGALLLWHQAWLAGCMHLACTQLCLGALSCTIGERNGPQRLLLGQQTPLHVVGCCCCAGRNKHYRYLARLSTNARAQCRKYN